MKIVEDDYYSEPKPQQKPSYRANKQDFGCEFCWDAKKKQNFEIYFFDRANNMRLSAYCPNCGRSIGENV